MDTIEEYKIIESQDLGSLVEKVNAALKEVGNHMAHLLFMSAAPP